MTRAALIKNGIVENIICIDVSGDIEAQQKEYDALKAVYDAQVTERKALEKKLKSLNKRFAGYKYKRDFVITDGEEFNKKHGKTVKGIISERDQIDKILAKPLKIPRKPRGRYEPPEGCEIVHIEEGQAVDIGWSYRDGGFVDAT